MRVAIFAIVQMGIWGCGNKHAPAPAPVVVAKDGGVAAAMHVMVPFPEKPVKENIGKPALPPVPCPVTDKQDVDAALDEAARRFDGGDFMAALACAEQASRTAPRSVEAHHDRADALAALERFDEAKMAYTMALALDPEDPQTLASAADFYINRLSPDHDFAAIGLEYAKRGSAHVGRRREDRELGARLALYEAEALDDLGRADEALPRAEVAVRLAGNGQDGSAPEARYEHALIQFHLCKLEKAERELEDVVAKSPDDAYAHHHLGLVLERIGDPAEAERQIAKAHELAPAQFPEAVIVSDEAFHALVDAAIAELEPAQRALLDSVKIEIVDVPAMADLTAVNPPFPPTILGLYRGAPLGEPAAEPGEQRAIVFYRKNLGRAVTTHDELVKQVKITLLHEMGHLTGADEDDLRARGLE